MNIYAFDCDETLEISDGPVTIDSIRELKAAGHVVGICGNWAKAWNDVHDARLLWSFLGQMFVSKPIFLREIKLWLPADDYVFVGNDHSVPRPGGYTSPNDAAHAHNAGWRFIREHDFAVGAR